MKKLDSIHITRTYSGCYEGVPSVESIIESAKANSNKMFGVRPILILDYETKLVGKNYRGEEQRMLPEWQHIAWISSYTPLKDGDGSHLVVIWFSENPSCDMVPVIDKIDWEKHAEDWWM